MFRKARKTRHKAKRTTKRKTARRKPSVKRRAAKRTVRKSRKTRTARRTPGKARTMKRTAGKAKPVRRAPTRKGQKNILLQQVEKLLGTFSDDMITALDLKDEKKNLLRKINELKREELHLMDMIEDIEATRDKQAMEIKKKEAEEEELKTRVSGLKDEKADMESEKITLNQQISTLKREKDDLNASLDRTNDLLVRFRAHIEEFDDDLKTG